MALSSTSTTQSEFDLTPEQTKFVREDSKRYIGFISGVGAGKTFAGIARTVRNMLFWNVDTMGAIVAPARRMIIDVIIPEMRNMGLFDPPINFEYKSAHSDQPGIHAPNGSRALLLSADNSKTIERLRGLNLSWWWMDEESEIEPRARQILMQRLRTGQYRNGFVTTTPKGKNHTWEFFRQDLDCESWDGAGNLYTDESTLSLVGVPTDANPELPADYKAAMEADMPEQIRAQEVEGEFIEIGSGIFTTDMLRFVDPETISEDYRLKTVIAIDPAATVESQKAETQDSDFWAATVVQVHPRTNKIWVTDTARKRGMTLQEGVHWIGQIANSARDANIVVETNQAQRWLLDELKDVGVHAQGKTSTRNKEERIVDLSIPLENGTIEFVDWNDGKPGENHPYQELVSELLSFPEGSHDDMVDSLHRAVDAAPVSIGANILGADPYGDSNE